MYDPIHRKLTCKVQGGITVLMYNIQHPPPPKSKFKTKDFKFLKCIFLCKWPKNKQHQLKVMPQSFIQIVTLLDFDHELKSLNRMTWVELQERRCLSISQSYIIIQFNAMSEVNDILCHM